MRAPFQVIVLPYYVTDGELKFLIGKRSDGGYWQAISGGGEDKEEPLEAAKRELYEEASLEGDHWIQLQSMCMLPKIYYIGHENWGNGTFVIPEYSFMVKAQPGEAVSAEHTELKWCSAIEAESLLAYDSNKIALWEATQRIHL
ncbi:NUDIX domain-containing protein [Marinimicrobium sp. C6131]|uniref:NUDIX hydrolase n=1 Tax=Marinimicrobium sp. C6131 TaxID=3022676 RepID=UPI00223CAE16|nr:NUDIX domain-containing protein [Marinimicrobium sp. C6131]UZJ43202.1 NUDIX domain-containing protein [Marinimicrobium sp. C6131]